MRAAAAGPGRSAVLVGRSLHRSGKRDVAASIGPGQGPHRRAAERGGAVAAAARGGAGARGPLCPQGPRAAVRGARPHARAADPRGAAARQRGQVPRHRRFRRPDDLVDQTGRLSRLLQPSLVRIHRRARRLDRRRGLGRMFHPDDQDRTWARWRQSLETGQPYEIEYRLRHRSGEYRWVLVAPSRSAMRRGGSPAGTAAARTSTASRWSRNSFS
ncbi:PAS domain-containing protein [Paracoccus marcusii]|uniref:PAS domain-containing protein n=1 Tax=Paracoccus marcusii TaxID=59779 RepID=UPI002ED0A0E6|nr:PAS domain-containing protein [Paracoccus marcusii]